MAMERSGPGAPPHGIPQAPPPQWAPPPYPQIPPGPPPYWGFPGAPPPPAQPPKAPDPWGAEDPVRWGARRARSQAIWGGAAIAALLVAFGAGLYIVFTYFLYNGPVPKGERGPVGGLLILVLSPLILSIVGAVAAGRLLRTGRMLRGREGAPEGLAMANLALALSVLLWVLLFPLFFVLLSMKTGEKRDFPIGLTAYLPVYLGLCSAVYTSGATMMAWSRATRVEAGVVLALGWSALVVYSLFPVIINPSRVKAGDWELVAFWFRFGALMAALLPCLSVVGLQYAHGHYLDSLDLTRMPTSGLSQPQPLSPGRPCPRCGATLTVHPRTHVTFCPACGEGLPPEPEVPWPPP